MAPRLFFCFGCGGRSSSSPEANTMANLTAEEQRQMEPVLVEPFSSQECGTLLEAECVVTRLRRGDLARNVGKQEILFGVFSKMERWANKVHGGGREASGRVSGPALLQKVKTEVEKADIVDEHHEPQEQQDDSEGRRGSGSGGDFDLEDNEATLRVEHVDGAADGV